MHKLRVTIYVKLIQNCMSSYDSKLQREFEIGDLLYIKPNLLIISRKAWNGKPNLLMTYRLENTNAECGYA
jgi:hypothetical protein